MSSHSERRAMAGQPAGFAERIGAPSGAKVALTLPLEALTQNDRALVGGKAVNLGRLLQAGSPVPRGFCVTTAAFDAFIAQAPIANELARHLSEFAPNDTDELAERMARASQRLGGVAVPAAVREAVRAAWEQLGPDRQVAVRSSATAEDGGERSFAGQFSSKLNVKGWEPLLEAIQSCWMSLFAARALAYQARQAIAPGNLRMAVIVQEMVAADVAGVLFTVDPVSGDGTRMILEAAPGLGEQVVSGHVAPEQIVLEKATGRIIPKNRSGADSLLKTGQLARLAELASHAEAVFGCPLDLEWATVGNRAFLLQARPITAMGAAPEWEDRQVWLNVNTGEIFPDVATPITWSMVQLMVAGFFASLARLLGAGLERAPWLGRVAGRVYFNANTGRAALRPFAIARRFVPEVIQAIGGGRHNELERMLAGLRDEDLPDLGFRWPKYLLSWPGLLWDLWTHRPARGQAWLTEVKRRSRAMARLELEHLSTQELTDLFARSIREGFRGWDLLYLATQGVALPVFRKACRDWLGDGELAFGSRLFAGLGGIPETEAGLALWGLAEIANRNGNVREAVLATEEWPILRGRLEATADGLEFFRAWDAFMVEHGHHCRGELELMNARWSEQPEYILRLLRGYIKAAGQVDPVSSHRRLREERERITRACLEKLSNPVMRLLFTWSLRQAQTLAVTREVWKDAAVRQIAALRRMLLILGPRLAHAGVLDKPSDVFFLKLEELEAAAVGQPQPRLRQDVTSRRSEYVQDQSLHPPSIVYGRFTGCPATDLPAAEDIQVLKGIAVFPGVATGRARVVLRADDHAQVLPGEVLIAPFTDPAWTPYFVTAAAVVMDKGGILSHGSIVAREYGLPAVTNAGCATRIIRTGDLVRVDGGRGQVTIISRGPGPLPDAVRER